MPSLAIVCPCYNDSHFLIQWIEKVSQQDFDEIIIVDDKSTDNTLELLKTFKNVKIIHNPKKGVFNAFIAGVKSASSDYICFSACDDHPLPDYSTKMKQAIEDYPFVDLYICASKVKRENEYYIRGLMPFNAYIDPYYAAKVIKRGFGKQLPMAGLVMRKETVLKCSEATAKMKANGDCLMNYYCMFSKGFIWLKDILYYYRSYPTSFGASGKLKHIIESNKMMSTFFRDNLTYEQFKLFEDAGICNSRETLLPYLALRCIMLLPKWARLKFYEYFYSYDWKVEKL
jgi:glycosyltransferase involved in cell wall biosynthesis